MTDPTKRPLQFPKWHIPYLEKHRINELFFEIARELLIQQPEDHILFMKQILHQAAETRDVSRLMLLGSPKINRINIAQEIAHLTGQIVITSNDIRNIFSIKSGGLTPFDVAKAITYLIRSQNVTKCGWIIADCVNTDEEAKFLLKFGILPTHVILLLTPFQLKLSEPLYCDVPENWPQIRRNLFGLKEMFKEKLLREVHLDDKTIVQVAKECCEIVRKNATSSAFKSVRPRVIILGPRGSGRKTQAKLLQQLLGLVHVDFEYILCQFWTSVTELGAQLRKCKKQVCFHSELLSQIVNKRILEKDCYENGWVLTGYPYTVTDFQFLDSLQTPPNRIICIDCDLNIAKERCASRHINAYTGSSTHLNANETGKNQRKVLNRHPKDASDIIQAEHDFYCQNYGSIKKYCGETLTVINGEQHERWVYESILSAIVGANPPGPPRKGFTTEIPDVCSCDCINIPSSITKTYVIPL